MTTRAGLIQLEAEAKVAEARAKLLVELRELADEALLCRGQFARGELPSVRSLADRGAVAAAGEATLRERIEAVKTIAALTREED